MKQSTKDNMAAGHIVAIITILIWGTTYTSTKVLLESFQPVEILFTRFVIGFLALLLISHKRMKVEKSQEKYFMLAGLLGITVYYLLENIALVYTQATNVGVIISVAPFFTALCSKWILKEGKITRNFILGFIVALLGIVLLSYKGNAEFQVNPLGDVLALLAGVVWALYSIVLRKLSSFGYSSIMVTRRTFFYGILFMIPAMMLMGYDPDYLALADPKVLGNMLFLGLGASAMCFVTWSLAVKMLGPVKTSVYIYLVPVVTTISAVFILHEKISKMAAIGILCTIGGLLLSQKKQTKHENCELEESNIDTIS